MDESKIRGEAFAVRLENEMETSKRLREDRNELMEVAREFEEFKNKYNQLEIPNKNLDNLENELRLADKFTMRTIVDYLKLDRYELVANLAKVIDSNNASQIIAYRDWAISRIEVLIAKIGKYANTKDTFTDRLKWEVIKKS